MTKHNEESLKSFPIYLIDIMEKKTNISFIKLLLNSLVNFLFDNTIDFIFNYFCDYFVQYDESSFLFEVKIF